MVKNGQQLLKHLLFNNLLFKKKKSSLKAKKNKDPTDTAKLKRYTCDAIKANKKEFMKFYEDFKNPKNDNSI